MSPYRDNHEISCQNTDADHPVCFADASRFNGEHLWVAMIARTVKFSAVDVNDQRLPGNRAESQSGFVGHPVVGMNDVEISIRQ